MIRIILSVILATSLLANFYLFVRLVDAGVMLDNTRSEVRRLHDRARISLGFVQRAWVGKGVASLSGLASALEKEGLRIDDSEQDAVEIGDLRFEVKGGVIVRVDYID
ncbi:hypothetical protein [Arenimonas fontis]|uniref:Uncharacterized protein n=1 Tax=Arenimonas fontis TaxID=2608255 RepID=A0A5B2ZCV6_9GAMM|nr:hypothetical protein [Arenimonas fontis]KAA2284952.1 hypothetical protein F0415_06800 [Arenimonas fontis]